MSVIEADIAIDYVSDRLVEPRLTDIDFLGRIKEKMLSFYLVGMMMLNTRFPNMCMCVVGKFDARLESESDKR